MKALTLTQPWATLVALGAKRIETRPWKTAYRGPLAIHAAKGFPEWARERCFEPQIGASLAAGGISNFNDLPRGAVIATCELSDCIQIALYNLPPVPEYYFGDYTPGRWAWYLFEIRALPQPIEARGALGLWEFEGGS